MISIKDSYNGYSSSCKSKNIERIDRVLYNRVCTQFMRFLSEKILEGLHIRLPSKIGYIYIRGKKQVLKNKEGKVLLPVDWQRTRKLWEDSEKAKLEKKLVFYTNEHSNGIIYSAFWDKNAGILKNRSLYTFSLFRNNKREIKKKIKSGTEYLIYK